MRVVEGSEAPLGRQVERILRRRILVAVDAAGVAELRGVGDRFRPCVRTQERNPSAEPPLQARKHRLIIGLRRVGQIIDLTNRNRIPDHVDVARERSVRRILHAEVRPPRIRRARAGVRVVGLNVLLQFESQSGKVSNFEHRASGQLALDREVPLQAIAGPLINVDAGGLDLHRSDHRRSERAQSPILRNEIVAAQCLRDIVG